MEQRVKNLEVVCELITKEIVEQNKQMIEMNKSLLSEIRSLREAYVKQDDDFEEFKNLLRKIYELNKSQTQHQSANGGGPPLVMPPPPPPPSGQYMHHPSHLPPPPSGQHHQLPPHFFQQPPNMQHHHPPAAAFMGGPPPPPPQSMAALVNQFPFLESQQQLKESQSLNQIKSDVVVQNQSMIVNNNASFSDKSTTSSLNTTTRQQQQQSFAPNSTFGSNYSIPSSTSTISMSSHTSQQVINKQQQSQQPQQSLFGKPPAQQQTQPFSFGAPTNNTTNPVMMTSTNQQPFKFGPPSSVTSTAATSTPQQQTQGVQQFSFGASKPVTSPQKQPPPSQQHQSQLTTGIKPPVFDVSPTKGATTSTTTPSANNNSKPFSFQPFSPASQPSASSNIFKVEPGKNLFTTTTTSPATSKQPDMASIFGKQPAASTTFAAAGQGDDDETGGAGGDPEEYEPQVEFTPIVHLKEVEVKTGEEDEDVLVKLRCKLFRFDSANKEWKEKGLGDVKLLRHKETKSIRVLMRREQVLKLCANHKISAEMKLSEIAPKQLSWCAVDYSEGEAKSELLAARFKTLEDADRFKSEFEKAVVAAATLPKSTPKKPPTTASSTTGSSEMKPSLSQVLKTDTWKCNTCYAPNNKETNKCACCATPRPGVPTSFTSPSLSTLGGAKEESKPTTSTFSFGTLGQSTSNQTPSKPLSFSFGLTSNNIASTTTTTTPPKFDFSAKEGIFNKPASNNNPSPSTSNTNIVTPSIFGTKTLTTSATVNSASSSATTNAPASGQFLFGTNANTPSFSSLATNSTSGGSIFGTLNPSGGGGGGNLFSTATMPSGTPGSFTGIGLSGPSTVKPLFGVTPQIKSGDGDEGDEGGENQNPEEYEPQVEFKPIVQLKEVDVKTGEEDEEATFKQRCKLYRFDSNTKEWKEKGTGEIKLLKHKENVGMYRMLMRRDQVLKLCLNHRITPDLKFEIYQEKQVRWHAEDYSEGAGKHELLAARFKNESDAKKLVDECLKAQQEFNHDAPKPQPKAAPTTSTTDPCQGLKPSLSELFKSAGGSWSCPQCLVNNDEKASKCAACAFARNNESGQEKTTSQPVTTTEPPKFSFGTMNSTSNAPKPSMENVFGAKQGLSFADLATGSKPFGFSGGFTNTASPKSLFGAGGGFGGSGAGVIKPLFGQPAATSNDNEEGGGNDEGGNPEEFEPQVEFKPLVQLKEVEVKTGEEDEEVLFKQRCKLYRFDLKTKEWKEKGTGEIKILKHKSRDGSYRVLMRRDQVLKLCANHKISSEIKLERVNEKQIKWMANDYSEDSTQPQLEMLLARFRQQEDATQFANFFEQAQKNAKLGPATSTTTSNVNNATSSGPSLASLLVKSGDWKCDTCLSTNKETASKCGACDSPKPADKLAQNDRDVVFEFAAMPSQELIQKARSLQLPDSFYLYMNKPNCPGCVGCEQQQQQHEE